MPRRWTDRVEDLAAWMLMAAALFVLLLAAVGGVRIAGDALDHSRLVQNERVEVDAQLLDDPPRPYRSTEAGAPAVRSVRFVDPAGQERLTDVLVDGRPPAGVVVRLWVDRTGELVPPPITPFDAAVLGLSTGLGIVVFGASALTLVWVSLRRLLDAHNRAAWAREWMRVEPLWSGREQRR